jgi:hypothetical protein
LFWLPFRLSIVVVTLLCLPLYSTYISGGVASGIADTKRGNMADIAKEFCLAARNDNVSELRRLIEIVGVDKDTADKDHVRFTTLK